MICPDDSKSVGTLKSMNSTVEDSIVTFQKNGFRYLSITLSYLKKAIQNVLICVLPRLFL